MGEEDQLIKTKRSQKLVRIKKEDKRSSGVLVCRILKKKKIHYFYQMNMVEQMQQQLAEFLFESRAPFRSAIFMRTRVVMQTLGCLAELSHAWLLVEEKGSLALRNVLKQKTGASQLLKKEMACKAAVCAKTKACPFFS